MFTSFICSRISLRPRHNIHAGDSAGEVRTHAYTESYTHSGSLIEPRYGQCADRFRVCLLLCSIVRGHKLFSALCLFGASRQVPALVHTISHSPMQDYYCYYCFHFKAYCQYVMNHNKDADCVHLRLSDCLDFCLRCMSVVSAMQVLPLLSFAGVHYWRLFPPIPPCAFERCTLSLGICVVRTTRSFHSARPCRLARRCCPMAAGLLRSFIRRILFAGEKRSACG